MHDDEVSERAVVRESRLALVGTHLFIALDALRAAAACLHERRRDSLAAPPPADIRSYRDDLAGPLVARHVGHGDARIVTTPRMPVAPADATGADPHQRAVPRMHRLENLTHGWPCTKSFDDDGSHELIPPRSGSDVTTTNPSGTASSRANPAVRRCCTSSIVILWLAAP